MGEFDLGEEQAGEGGEGFMDLGAAIGNKVAQRDHPTSAKLAWQMMLQLHCPSISF